MESVINTIIDNTSAYENMQVQYANDSATSGNKSKTYTITLTTPCVPKIINVAYRINSTANTNTIEIKANNTVLDSTNGITSGVYSSNINSYVDCLWINKTLTETVDTITIKLTSNNSASLSYDYYLAVYY